MRVGVIGAGAVGGTIAALLDRAGHEVSVTARGEHLQRIREHGLVLDGAWGEHTARIEADARLTHPVELAILATKAMDAEAALLENSAILGDTPLVVVQNGLHGLDTARSVLPRSDLVGALALYAASLVEPGHVRVTTPGLSYLGGDTDLAVRFAESVLGAATPVRRVADFAGAQWTKLLVNQINALPAITGLSAQDTIADRGLRRLLTLSLGEASRAALRSGTRLATLQGLSPLLIRVLAHLPWSIAQLIPLVIRRRMGRTPNPGSTLQSIRRGRLTEIDELNGAIVRAGARLGVTTPINALLVDLVHEVEQTGEFLAPAEVVARAAAPSDQGVVDP